MRKYVSAIVVLVVISTMATLKAESAHASALSYASASASTSRPSPSSPLDFTVPSDPLTAGTVAVKVFDNGSTFLASDSAKLIRKDGASFFTESITIASVSADRLTPSFTTATLNSHNKTTVLATPITAMHAFVFNVQTPIPSGGKIKIQYPSLGANDTNAASPSASTYMFNNLASGDIKMAVSLGGATIGSCTTTAPTISCTTATAVIPTGATVWLFVGCTAVTKDSSGAYCSTQKPLLINPTNTGARGTASVKNIVVSTEDAISNTLDSSTLKIGTIESVLVNVHIDPTLSFSLAGINNNTALAGNSYCGASTSFPSITTGTGSTATNVNYDNIPPGTDTYAAQLLTITSNAVLGYTVTATSSGFLINPATGYYIPNFNGNPTNNNTPAPSEGTAANGYGIHPCDPQSYAATHVFKTLWYNAGKDKPKYANPSSSFYYTLVNYVGTLGNENVPTTGKDIFTIIYRVNPAVSTPPGDYWQIMTYNVSATF